MFSEPQNPLETLKLGQTSDRNGFVTLKIGGSHVASPWDQLFLTRRPPGGVAWRVRVPVCVGTRGTQARARAHVRVRGEACVPPCPP